MLTYLTSHLHCSRFSKRTTAAGFSLVELLVVIAITALISTVVVIRFTSFDSTVLLKGLAYDIAVSLREAQVYSLSALGQNSGGFDRPFGMSFTPDSKEYAFFQYNGAIDTLPRHDSGSSNTLNTFTIGRSLQVSELCVTTPSVTNCDDIERLDISFRRPEFEALFYATGSGWNESRNDDIVNVQVKVRSLVAEDVWMVEVSRLGQITVREDTP